MNSITLSFYIDDDFSGISMSAAYAPSNHFAVRGMYYDSEHDDFSLLDQSGIEILAQFGSGFINPGFKAFLGFGLFDETLEVSSTSFEFDASGILINGGIGYNWDSISLDWMLSIRDPSDYEDFVNIDAAAVSSALILSARF